MKRTPFFSNKMGAIFASAKISDIPRHIKIEAHEFQPIMLPSNMWEEVNGDTFTVRHTIYRKGLSEKSKFELVNIYYIKDKIPICNIISQFPSIIEGVSVNDFLFAVQIMIPNMSFIILYKCDQRSIISCEEKDFFFGLKNNVRRNEQFKLIPKIIDGNIIIKMAVEDRPF